MWSVALGGMSYEESVPEEEERCLPAWTMRRSEGVGYEVRSARSERSVLIEVFDGIERGIAIVFVNLVFSV